MTPQVMQQLFQLGQVFIFSYDFILFTKQFKQITESSIIEPAQLANSALSSMNSYSSSSFQKGNQFQTQIHSYKTNYQGKNCRT